MPCFDKASTADSAKKKEPVEGGILFLDSAPDSIPDNTLVVCAGTVTATEVTDMGSGFNTFHTLFKDKTWREPLQKQLDAFFKGHGVMPTFTTLEGKAAASRGIVGAVATVPYRPSGQTAQGLVKGRVFTDDLLETQYKNAVRGAALEALKQGKNLYLQPLGIGVYGWNPKKAAELTAEAIKEAEQKYQEDNTLEQPKKVALIVPMHDMRTRTRSAPEQKAFDNNQAFHDALIGALKRPTATPFAQKTTSQAAAKGKAEAEAEVKKYDLGGNPGVSVIEKANKRLLIANGKIVRHEYLDKKDGQWKPSGDPKRFLDLQQIWRSEQRKDNPHSILQDPQKAETYIQAQIKAQTKPEMLPPPEPPPNKNIPKAAALISFKTKEEAERFIKENDLVNRFGGEKVILDNKGQGPFQIRLRDDECDMLKNKAFFHQNQSGAAAASAAAGVAVKPHMGLCEGVSVERSEEQPGMYKFKFSGSNSRKLAEKFADMTGRGFVSSELTENYTINVPFDELDLEEAQRILATAMEQKTEARAESTTTTAGAAMAHLRTEVAAVREHAREAEAVVTLEPPPASPPKTTESPDDAYGAGYYKDFY